MRSPVLFGKHLLLERISVGGMAEVFKAKTFGPDGFEKIVAIKRILPSMAEDQDFISMFIDEAKIAGQLSHANICQIFELGKIGSSHFIAMEYVQGKDVLQIQNRFRRLRKQMPLPMAALIAAKICEGLDYAHRKCDKNNQPLNIIHRDVSPQNILVSYEGEVKIIDFGIAKAVSRSSKTQAGVLKGKFGYMSPEQVRGLPLDRRSDTFAIGTLLWEMCTDERLFAGPSDFAVLEKVRNATVPPPSSHNPMIPPELEAIIMRALKRDPLERYQWSAEMQEALQNYLLAQSPPWTSAMLSSMLKELFAREMAREQAALEHYRNISAEDLSKYAAPAARRQSGVSLLHAGGPEGSSAVTPAVRAADTAANEAKPLVSLEDDEDALDHDPTQIGGPVFAVPSASALVDAIQVSESEEFDDGATLIFTDAEHGKDPEPGEPTFIFNSELGQIEHAAGRPLLAQPTGGGNGQSTASLDHGPTVVFNYEDVAKAPAAVEAAEGRSSTATLVAPSTVFKDILIGVLSAAVLILTGTVVWFVVVAQPPTASPAVLVVSTEELGHTRVLIDGQARGTLSPGTPVTIRGIAPGKHWLMVSPQNADPIRFPVELEPGEVKEFPVSWSTADGSTASATGQSDAGAAVRESDVGASAPDSTRGASARASRPDAGPEDAATADAGRLAPALPDARVSRGRSRRTRSSRSRRAPRAQDAPRSERAGRSTKTRVRAKRPAERPAETAASSTGDPGYLVANTIPWAKVVVDGRKTGRDTPITPSAKLKLKPGRHRVTFVVGEEKFSYTVTIRSGEITRLIKKLPISAQ
jgi:serine/threonine protein kinase